MRWHRHPVSHTTKAGAVKSANGLKRKSFWRKSPDFKVKIESRSLIHGSTGKKVKVYEVFWYGKDNAI